RIVTWDGDLESAAAPQSVTLVLADEIDISRGDTLASEDPEAAPAHRAPHVGRQFTANLVWMDERPLQPGRPYVLKHGTRTVTAEVRGSLSLNQIGVVPVSTGRPLVFEPYATNRTTGSFILI